MEQVDLYLREIVNEAVKAIKDIVADDPHMQVWVYRGGDTEYTPTIPVLIGSCGDVELYENPDDFELFYPKDIQRLVVYMGGKARLKDKGIIEIRRSTPSDNDVVFNITYTLPETIM